MKSLLRRCTALVISALVLSGCRGGAPVPRRVVDLSPVLTADANQRRLGSRVLEFLGTVGTISCEPVLPPTPTLAYGIERICLLSQSGSHLDAPARLLRGGEHAAEVPLERLSGPMKLIDLRWHDRESPLQITDLETAPIEAGDVVTLFVGYELPGSISWPRYAPLSAQASEWLVAKRIRALATDLPAIARHEDIADRLSAHLAPEEVWAEHIPFFQAQIPVIAGLVNLEGLVDEDDVLFIALPLPLADATGSPLRAAALVY